MSNSFRGQEEGALLGKCSALQKVFYQTDFKLSPGLNRCLIPKIPADIVSLIALKKSRKQVPSVIVSMFYQLEYPIAFRVVPRCSQTLDCCKTLPCRIPADQSGTFGLVGANGGHLPRPYAISGTGFLIDSQNTF